MLKLIQEMRADKFPHEATVKKILPKKQQTKVEK